MDISIYKTRVKIINSFVQRYFNFPQRIEKNERIQNLRKKIRGRIIKNK